MDEQEKAMFLGWARLPQFKSKVEKAKQLIKEASELGNCCVTVSWGKDSVVLLRLCQLINPDIVALHLKWDLQQSIYDYDSIIQSYLAKYSTNYEELSLFTGERIPDAINRVKPFNRFDCSFIGLRKEENPNTRGRSIFKYGLLHQYQTGKKQNTWRCLPLGYWTWRDIWAFIVSNDLPYLPIYDELDRAKGRTCNILPTKLNQKGASIGRIAELKKYSPEAYSLAIQINPLLNQLT